MAQHLPYRVLLRSMGRSFVVLGALGRLPTGILPLAMLIYAYGQLGSFGLAGLATAALSLGGAAGAVLIGYLSDTLGQRWVGVGATAVQTVAVLGFMWTCRPDVSLAPMLLFAAMTGFANPQLGAMARARWSQAAASGPDRAAYTSAAMAWEGAVDELAFIVGPVLATTLAAIATPLPLFVAIALAWIGQAGFALHRSALPAARHGRVRHEASPTRIDWPILATLSLAAGSVGLLFGGAQTSVTAFFTLRGEDAITGLVYSMMAVGSTGMGLLSNRFPARFALTWRIAWFGLGCALVSPLLVFAGNAWTMAIACFAIGLTVGPTLVTIYALAERIAPPERLGTVMTVMATIGVVGVAAGSALGGQLIDAFSSHVAAWITTAGGLLVGVCGLVLAWLLRASGPRRASQPGASDEVV